MNPFPDGRCNGLRECGPGYRGGSGSSRFEEQPAQDRIQRGEGTLRGTHQQNAHRTAHIELTRSPHPQIRQPFDENNVMTEFWLRYTAMSRRSAATSVECVRYPSK